MRNSHCNAKWVVLVAILSVLACLPIVIRGDEPRRLEEEAARKNAMLALVETWNQGRTVELTSDDLLSEIHDLPYTNLLLLPRGGETVDHGDLSEPVHLDLNAAIAGFLDAEQKGTPAAIIAYMQERGMRVGLSPRFQAGMERGLTRTGTSSNLSGLTDEELYRLYWTTATRQPTHWRAIALDSSVRQVWRGESVPVEELERFDDANLDELTPLAELDQSGYLCRLFGNVATFRSSFVSTSGSIGESVEIAEDVMLCDVQLMVKFDAAFPIEKGIYLVRFWWNPQLKKWQPKCLRGFSPDQGKFLIPEVLF